VSHAWVRHACTAARCAALQPLLAQLRTFFRSSLRCASVGLSERPPFFTILPDANYQASAGCLHAHAEADRCTTMLEPAAQCWDTQKRAPCAALAAASCTASQGPWQYGCVQARAQHIHAPGSRRTPWCDNFLRHGEGVAASAVARRGAARCGHAAEASVAATHSASARSRCCACGTAATLLFSS
jgi:hypothetical protein